MKVRSIAYPAQRGSSDLNRIKDQHVIERSLRNRVGLLTLKQPVGALRDGFAMIRSRPKVEFAGNTDPQWALSDQPSKN